MAKDILHSIESAGASGIKKTDLKKRYGKDCDDILEKLKEAEQIFIEKKGTAYFIWTKENYIRHLTQNDPKFKVILDMVLGVSQSVATLRERTQNLREEMESISSQDSALTNNRDFETIFNKCLQESATSMGWAPLSTVREKICGAQNLSKEKFYTLATDLIERNRERYEISSGGQEGIIVRGLVHGYVRNI